MRNAFNTILYALIVSCILLCLPAPANDTTYSMSGNHLIPLKETEISVSKEILTMELNDSGFIEVDVYYEFFNPGGKKTITVGFEAEPPTKTFLFSREGIHPFMSDFTAVVNGELLEYRTGLVHRMKDKVKSKAFQPIENLDQLCDMEHASDNCPYWDTNALWNETTEDIVFFSYAYYCQMTFKPGINIVRHHYKYKESDGVGYIFHIPYLLTPALRWANHQIDDFTLRITAPKTAKHFLIVHEPFRGSEFYVKNGAGKIRNSLKGEYSEAGKYIEVSLRNGAVEWHSKNFRPKAELTIYSADWDLPCEDHCDLYDNAILYDRTKPEYMVNDLRFLTAEQIRILRNAPYANRGYIFRDKALQEYFNNIWWYMPDPDYVASDKDFTPKEKAIIKAILEAE